MPRLDTDFLANYLWIVRGKDDLDYPMPLTGPDTFDIPTGVKLVDIPPFRSLDIIQGNNNIYYRLVLVEFPVQEDIPRELKVPTPEIQDLPGKGLYVTFNGITTADRLYYIESGIKEIVFSGGQSLSSVSELFNSISRVMTQAFLSSTVFDTLNYSDEVVSLGTLTLESEFVLNLFSVRSVQELRLHVEDCLHSFELVQTPILLLSETLDKANLVDEILSLGQLTSRIVVMVGLEYPLTVGALHASSPQLFDDNVLALLNSMSLPVDKIYTILNSVHYGLKATDGVQYRLQATSEISYNVQATNEINYTLKAGGN